MMTNCPGIALAATSGALTVILSVELFKLILDTISNITSLASAHLSRHLV
jgi:hypothetical protein